MSQVPLLPGLSQIEDENVQKVFQTIITYMNQQDNGIQTVSAFVDRGTQIADSAQPGNVGQYVVSYQTNVAGGATGVYVNIASISLTAGDWDVSGNAVVAPTSGNTGFIAVALSLYSGNTSTDHQAGDNVSTADGPSNFGSQAGASIPAWRVSLASTTTVYLKGYALYTSGTIPWNGRISARRVR